MLTDIFGWSALILVGYLFLRAFRTYNKKESYRKFEDCWAKTKSEAQYYPIDNEVDKRTEFTKEQKRKSAEDHGWKCTVCGVKLSLNPKSRDQILEGDHVIPAWINGPNADWNIKPKCRKHNRKKGRKLDRETFELLRSRSEKVWLPEHLKRRYVRI